MSLLHSGFAVGPIIAGFVLALGYTMLEVGSILYVLGCVSALAVAAVWFSESKKHGRTLEAIREVMLKDKVFLREIMDYSKLKSTGLAILAMTFLFTFYDGAVWILEPLYYSRFTSNAVLGGLVMSAFVVPLILFEIPGGWLADRFSRKKVLAVGMSIAGVFSIAFSLAGDIQALFATAFIATTGLALAWPSMEGILTVKSCSDDRGSILGVWSTARDLGYVVGPLGGGLLGHYFGLDRVFMILGILLLTATILTLAVKEK
jgi:MFS family permease